jgi:hypothetical protein
MLFRKGQWRSVVNARDRFIRDAVLHQGYLASQVAKFLNCHPFNISRALQQTSQNSDSSAATDTAKTPPRAY